MRDITTAMINHLASETPDLATLWVITTRDGGVVRSTDFPFDITFEGNTYAAVHGSERTAIQLTSDLTEDNMQTRGFLDIAAPRSELAAGRFDGAQVSLFQINPNDHGMGKIMLMSGRFEAITIKDYEFTTGISSRISEFKLSKVEMATPECRAIFGDARCGINAAAHTVTGTVTAVNNTLLTLSTGMTTALDLSGGLLTWTSGVNVGAKNDVKTFASGVITLHYWPVYQPSVGDAFSIVRGCDKRLATCRDVFANAANFRGEPNIPGSTKIFKVVGRKAEK